MDISPTVTIAPEAKLPICRMCGFKGHWLGDHLVETHNLDIKAYLVVYPNSPTVSQDVLDMLKAEAGKNVRRQGAVDNAALSIRLYDFNVRVNADVPADACLPLPDCWRWVENDDLKVDFIEALIAVLKRRHLYIWGFQGASKDSFIHALSAIYRLPAKMFQIQPEADVQAWLFSHEFRGEETYYKEGELLKAIRDGYTCPETGRVIPYIILLTDFDRATKNQVEALRLILDSISGRVMGPGGKLFSVLPGTMFVATANTAGGGDERGRYTSSNIIDASMLDRFERKLQFHWMAWADEGPIVQAKFPLLRERCPGIFPQVGNATKKVRASIYANTLYCEFSHRAVCAWLGHAQDIVELTGNVPKDLAQRALRVWLDGLPDEATRLSAERLISPAIAGGVLGQSDSGKVDSSPLGGFT